MPMRSRPSWRAAERVPSRMTRPAAAPPLDVDVAIIGGGIVGASLAAALAGTGLRGAPDLTLRGPARAEEVAINAATAELTVAGEDGERQRVTARLLVGADGADSQVRALARIGACVEDYDQVAVVGNVATDRPHRDIAYERFTRGGPLAV